MDADLGAMPCKTGGVKNYFVEQSWELTRQSVADLKTLKV